MNKRKVALGPGAASLILIVVMLSLCMLAMLMQIGSRNDNSLTTRSSEMISRVYQLNERAERRLAELDAVLVHCRAELREGQGAADMETYLSLIEQNLPEGFEITDDQITWTDPLDNRTLTCTVQVLPPEEPLRTKWIAHKLAVEEPEDEWEWE